MITFNNLKTRQIARNIKKVAANNGMISTSPKNEEKGWSVNIGFEPLATPLAIKERAKQYK